MSSPDWRADPRADAALVATLLEAVPQLADSYKEHLDGNGELLPFVYVPNVIRVLVTRGGV